jgi:hypothetical protein
MRWAGNVARMVRREVHTKFWLENLKGRDTFADLGKDERVILKWILKKQGVGLCFAFSWFRVQSSS